MRAHRFAAVDEVSEQIFEEVFFDEQPAARTPGKRNRTRTRLLNLTHYVRDHADATDTAAYVVEQPHAPEAPKQDSRAGAAAKTHQDAFGYVVIVDGPGHGTELPLTKSVNMIGRGLDQDVRLQFGDPYISRTAHARVHYKRATGLIAIQSGEKNNPVLLNRRVLHGTQLLRDGDLVTLGQTTLRFVSLDKSQAK